MVGFYSLSVHTKGRPKLASVVGLIKLAVLLVALQSFGSSLIELVSVVTAIMLAFEILLVLLLAWER